MRLRTLGKGGPSVSAIGLGAMPLSISGRPTEEQAFATVRAALEMGVTFIDTADAYCLDDRDFNHNERLLAKALEGRREGILIATKCGCRRPGSAWTVDARPEALERAAHASLVALQVETLDLLQLHAPDSNVPFEESVGALAKLREAGKVRLVGLSNVTASQIEKARRIVPIASVQNRWNPMSRGPEKDGVLAACQKHDIAFLPYSPFGGQHQAPLLSAVGKLADEARRRRMSPHRLVLAWMLSKSPVVIPIPGARRPESIRDSAEAARVTLTTSEVAAVEASFA